MIHAVRANRESFRTLELSAGFNVVLADRTKESTKKDSRNGLGKTTLVEVIHFCLGASARARQGLRVPALAGWELSLELDVGKRRVTVYRSVDTPRRVEIEGETGGWPAAERSGERLVMHVNEWTRILGEEMFGVPSEDGKYPPSFRSLICYMARRGRDAFSTPFEHYRKQLEWDKQVNNAFLLGLSWENAAAWQKLKDDESVLSALKAAVASGLVEGMMGGSVGELEAEKVRLEETARRQAEELESFRVHPQYREIEQEASALTQQIHALSNENVTDRRMLGFYQEGLVETGEADPEEVAKLYRQAGVQLPGAVLRRLEQVQSFHIQLVSNRRAFLAAEVERIEAAIETREAEIQRLTARRAELMAILRQHGALDEYTLLQQRHLGTTAQLKDLETRIANMRKFEAGRSALKIEQERLHQRARRDHDERKAIRERAISLFNAHSEALYEAPGRLVIDIGDKGFRFNVDIERSGSQGIDSMKVFCYDLMVAQLWAGKHPSPGFLIHDSTIFDGVDERQVALALERAALISRQAGFQYLCTLNSDTLPRQELSADFGIDSFVRLRLTDDKPEGSLLGIRF